LHEDHVVEFEIWDILSIFLQKEGSQWIFFPGGSLY